MIENSDAQRAFELSRLVRMQRANVFAFCSSEDAKRHFALRNDLSTLVMQKTFE